MRKVIWGVTAVLMLGSGSLILAEGGHKYIGVKKCSICHKSEAKGNQYGQWVATAHANAYKTLSTAQAKETAAKAGVTGNPEQAPQCLKCHVTAFDADISLLEEGFAKEDGVQCEACHGAGGDYKGLSVMKDKNQAIAAGLVMPTKEVCVKCHNSESPNYQEFNFDEYYKKIAHPRPE